MTRTLLLTQIFLSLTLLIQSQEWNKSTIGTCPEQLSWGIEIADARNDGINRLYVSTRNAHVYEWSYTDGKWDYLRISTSKMTNLIPVTSGAIKNDGQKRLYYAEWKSDGKIYEAEWDGSTWKPTIIGTSASSVTGLLIGDGRNDGTQRLYVSSFGGIVEYTWNSTKNDYDIVNVYSHESEGIGFIGEGRNDSELYFYSQGAALYEFRWDGSSFVSDNVTPDKTHPEYVSIGQPRNDGINRICAKTGLGRIECTYNNGSWDIHVITDDKHRGAIVVGKTQSDGKERIYSNFCKGWKVNTGPLVEYEWNGSSYDENTIVDATSGATGLIAIGDARNDGINRMYIPHYSTGGIYEFTHETPFSTSVTSTQHKTSCDVADTGTVVETFVSHLGYDSIVTTITDLLPSDNLLFESTSCNPSDAGTLTETLTNRYGCDSIVTTTVSLSDSYSQTINKTTCLEADTGSVKNTFTSLAGCDSVVTTITSLLPSHSISLDKYSCSPADTGKTVQNLTNSFGCDSVVTTHTSLTEINTALTANKSGLTADIENASYQWLDCKMDMEPIEGEHAQSYAPLKDGEYAVEISANGCKDTSECFVVENTGILYNNFNAQIKIYPNPVHDYLNIEHPEHDVHIEIHIFSIDGALVLNKAINTSGETKIPLLALPSGLYLLKIKSLKEDKQLLYKFVKN